MDQSSRDTWESAVRNEAPTNEDTRFGSAMLNSLSIDLHPQLWFDQGFGEGFKAGLAEGYRMAVEESYPELLE